MTDCNPHCTLIDKAFGGHIRPNNKICLFPVTLLTLFFVKIVFSFLIKKRTKLPPGSKISRCKRVKCLPTYPIFFQPRYWKQKYFFVWPNLVFNKLFHVLFQAKGNTIWYFWEKWFANHTSLQIIQYTKQNLSTF